MKMWRQVIKQLGCIPALNLLVARGSAVILSSGWSLLSTTSGKVYNGSIRMNFGLGKRVTLTVRSSQGVTLRITFLWPGSVKILSVQ